MSSLADRLRQIEGVADVAPSLVDTVAFEDKNLASVLVNGWVPGEPAVPGHPHPRRSGARARRRQGRHARPGPGHEPRQEGRRPARRSRVRRSKSWGSSRATACSRTASLIMPLKTLQKMMGREGQATGLRDHGDKASDRALHRCACGERIEATDSRASRRPPRATTCIGDTQIRLARAMAWTTAAVALILGSVGMLNTMLMSIFERTREIGILRAVGWRRRRVLALVLGEALVIALAGTAARRSCWRSSGCGP